MKQVTRVEGNRLKDQRILIVEDEPFIAFDLADAVEVAGGTALGPAMSVRDALRLIDEETVDAAILDVNLSDGDIGPVLSTLQERGVAFIIHTGAGLTPALQRAYPDLRVFPKPTSPHQLAGYLAASLAKQSSG